MAPRGLSRDQNRSLDQDAVSTQATPRSRHSVSTAGTRSESCEKTIAMSQRPVSTCSTAARASCTSMPFSTGGSRSPRGYRNGRNRGIITSSFSRIHTAACRRFAPTRPDPESSSGDHGVPRHERDLQSLRVHCRQRESARADRASNFRTRSASPQGRKPPAQPCTCSANRDRRLHATKKSPASAAGAGRRGGMNAAYPGSSECQTETPIHATNVTDTCVCTRD